MTARSTQPEYPLVRGRYRAVRRIGTGGMGVVYEARDELLQRHVAFKQLRVSQLAPDKRKLIETLFEREYHTLVRLRHPRIVTVYEYGLHEDGPYYTMELLSGRDLQEVAPLPYREVCRHLRDVASGLALLHTHGLVHRDVSPRNVRLTADGHAKLFDFGALAPFGVASSVVGTPISMAPELLRRMPLDQRADLYSLGVLGYVALTGQAPFPARRVDELVRLWREPPKPPSAHVRDVPAALDALLGSLLRVDPLARPSSAAEVIDQLTRIGELPAEEQEQAEQSYLLSCRLVGREREQEWLHKCLARLARGKGAQVVIEAGPGLGKTRLLHELSLEAQLRGVLTLKADAQAAPEPFGVALRLGLELLLAAPEQALAAAQPHAAVLGQLSEALREALGGAPPSPAGIDAAERRSRVLAALHDWFFSVAGQRPLLLAVDNLQSADHDSAAFLAALGHAASERAILLMVTLRSGEAPVASEALRTVRFATRLRLNTLTLEDCEALVRGLFGDVPNTGRVARALYERSAGHPGHCLDLAQLLVRKHCARYVAGTWVLPQELEEGELPNQVEALITARLSGLSEVARALIELLSVDNAPASIERCLALCRDTGKDRVYQALDELVSEQILVGDAERYWFRQDAQRVAVLAQMDDARRRERHLQLGHELLSGAPRFSEQVAAAWHLLRGGEETRGADLIVRAAHACWTDTQAYTSCAQVVRALVKALEIYDKQGRTKHELADLLSLLVGLAFLVDGQLVLDHGERALALAFEVTGLADADRAASVLGKKLGVVAGLAKPALRFAWLRARGRDLQLKIAIRSLLGMIPAAVGAASVFFDTAAIMRIERMSGPIALLGGPDELPDVIVRFVRIQRLMSQGREREAAEELARLAPVCRSPAVVAAIGEGHSLGMYGGVLYCWAVMQCYQFGSRALELAAEMETLGVQTWTTASEQVRLLYHSLRGEAVRVQECRERVERFAMRGDSTWQMDVFLPALMTNADLLIADTLSMRHHAEQLERRAQNAPSLEPYAKLAHAGYLSLHGDLPGAIAAFEQLLSRFPPRMSVAWLSMRAHFAAALNRAGEYARARQLLIEALSHSAPQDYVTVTQHLEAQRQLALAEAGVGNYDAAVASLDALLAEHGQRDNPLLVGLLHKARAELALAMDDGRALREHLGHMDQLFRATQSPALIAQVERLAIRAATTQAWLNALRSDPANDVRAARTSIPITLSDLMTAPDRCRYALQVVLQRTKASGGCLYLLEADQLTLAVASACEPPPELERELRDRACALQRTFERALQPPPDREFSDAATQLIDEDALASDVARYEIVMLTARQSHARTVVGGLILQDSQRAWLDASFLASISQALHDRHSIAPTKLLTAGSAGPLSVTSSIRSAR